jgi:hypothetical protein
MTIAHSLHRSLANIVAASVLLLACLPGANAGDADVIEAAISAAGDSRFRIDATVAHADTGWDHYADRWDVLTEDGTLLGTRTLHHPHETEQPFTRSLTLEIPADVLRVVIRAGDSVHGDAGGQTVTIDVPH